MAVEIGRIESEFIFTKLRETRPTLHIQHTTDCIHVKKGEYICNQKGITSRFDNEIHYTFNNLRILFQYNNTTYFFMSNVIIDGGTLTIPFMPQLFREDRVVDIPSTSKICVGQNSIEIKKYYDMPNGYLDSLVENGLHDEKIQRIADKFQLPETHSLLLVQVYSFFEIQKDSITVSTTHKDTTCIAFDHEFGIFCIHKNFLDQALSLKFCGIDFHFKNRIIHIQGEIVTNFAIITDIHVVTIKFVHLFREDMRFLFERFYKTQFEG